MMEDFEEALIQIFNQTPLPFEAKRYVVLKFARDVEETYQAEKKRKAEREKANDDKRADSQD